MMKDVPKILDWVSIRAGCSPKHVFRNLAEVVSSDVESMKKHYQGFEFQELSEDRFSVSRKRNLGGFIETSFVVFELADQAIRVRSGPEQRRDLFTAKPSVDRYGECKLNINEEPMELWQVSRRALEDLFFSRE